MALQPAAGSAGMGTPRRHRLAGGQVTKPRAADVRLVSQLLQDEHPDVESLAYEVIVALDAARLERGKKEGRKGLLMRAGEGLPLLVVGPFPTPRGLDQWAKKNNVTPDEATVVIVRRPEEV
jgi:hypothetical protein